MAKSNNNSNSGVGFFGLLAILFIALKLTGYINWSWWLVMLPLYGPLLFVIGIFIVVFLIGLFLAVTKGK